jgi:hypothetical protein
VADASAKGNIRGARCVFLLGYGSILRNQQFVYGQSSIAFGA